MQHLPGPDHVVHRPQDLQDGRREVPHVQVQDVDVIRGQPPEAPLQRPDQVLPVVPSEVGVPAPLGQRVLRGHHEVVPVGTHELADQLLALAVGVVAGRVHEGAAGLGERVEDLPGRRRVGAPAPRVAERHGPQGELGHPEPAGSQEPVAHHAASTVAAWSGRQGSARSNRCIATSFLRRPGIRMGRPGPVVGTRPAARTPRGSRRSGPSTGAPGPRSPGPIPRPAGSPDGGGGWTSGRRTGRPAPAACWRTWRWP